MKSEAYRLLKSTGCSRQFFIMLLLRSPFDILNNILTANMLQCFFKAIMSKDSKELVKSFFFFLFMTSILFGYNMTIWATIAVKVSVLFQKNLRKNIFEKVLALPPEVISKSLGTDYISKLNSDVDKACGYLMSPINYLHMIIAFVNLCISSIIMMIMGIEMYLIGMIVVFVSFGLNTLLISQKISEHKGTAQKKLVQYTDLIGNTAKSWEMLSVFEGGDFLRKKLESESLGILRANMKAHNRLALCNMTFSIAGMIGYLMVLLWGNGIIKSEEADFSALMKATQYRAGAVMSVNVIYNSINNMKSNFVGVTRITELLLSGDKECRKNC